MISAIHMPGGGFALRPGRVGPCFALRPGRKRGKVAFFSWKEGKGGFCLARGGVGVGVQTIRRAPMLDRFMLEY